jgi:hypothetical protein
MKPSSVLVQARAIIADPNKWTTQAFARDKGGYSTSAHSENACRFCAVGAVKKVLGDNRDSEGGLLYKVWNLLDEASGSTIAYTNDNKGHAEVLAAYDKAIHLANQQESV